MKLLLLLVFVFSVNSLFALPIGISTKEVYEAITAIQAVDGTQTTDIGTNTSNIATNTANILLSKKRAVYTLPATFPIAAGTTATGVMIPAGSIITQSFMRIGTQIVSANDNTIAFTCESAADLFTAADLTDTVAGIIAGKPAAGGAVTTYIYSDGCNISMVIGAGASGITAGALQLIVEYETL